MLDGIADQVKELYSINGMLNIDSNVSVGFKVFKGSVLQNLAVFSLQNAVSQLVSACANLLKDINDINARLSLFENIESTYQGFLGVFAVSNQLTTSRLANLENIETACDSVQYCLFLLLAIPLLWRVFRANKFS